MLSTELHEDRNALFLDEERDGRYTLLERLAPSGAEDFITEVFCWLLNHTSFGKIFLKNLEEIGVSSLENFKKECSWETQKSYRLDESDRRLDMVCLSNDGKSVLIFEHKVGAAIDKQQLRNYEQIARERFTNWSLVLITASGNGQDQSPYRHLLWRQIYEWLLDWNGTAVDNTDGFITWNFLKLLEDRGLGPMKEITAKQLQAIPLAREGERRLKLLVNSVAKHPNWAKLAEGIQSEMSNTVQIGRDRGFRWGRYGLYLIGHRDPGSWNPGVFVGVMYDSSDHGPSSVNDQQGSGPIACLIVDVHNRHHGKYEISEQFRSLTNAIHKSDAFKDWQIYEYEKNRWHPLTIYKPLESIFRNADTGDDQVDTFVEEVSKVAYALLHLEEFTQFWRYLVDTNGT